MCKQKEKWKTVFKAVLTIAMMCYLALNNWQIVLAEEAPEERTEVVAGEIYRFKNSENYDISSADSLSVDNTEKKSYGQFSITGNISTVTEKNGFPAYSVSGGTLAFSYMYNDNLLNASEDEEHLVRDSGKRINGENLTSEINKGALIIQTSKDGHIWFDVRGTELTNLFEDNPNGLNAFYTTTDVQLYNGCYYRILIAYETAIRTQKAQKFPPKLEKFGLQKYLEAFTFYAYDETAIKIDVPESDNRRNLGTKVRTKSEGYVGSAAMDNDDPHFGWDMGQFFVGGFTDYEDDAEGNPIFLKNNGDRLSLWFELQQDIDKCYGNSAIKVIADTEGSDAYFEVPPGVNETTDFGRGTLIIRKTNADKTKETPQIYTNYLEASASTDAVTKVDLLEEGDYEVALDYAVKFDKTKIFGKSILPETAKYRIFFKFSVRNGNSMVFLFDKETGSELSSGSITETGFKLDYANSKYLRVNVKREILKDGFDGLAEDTRFNSVATDGDEFTDEGVYTITVTNRDIDNIEPTVKRVYVGTNNVLKAYMVNNMSISDIKEMVALGATITDEGLIVEPEAESTEEINLEEMKKETETSQENELFSGGTENETIKREVTDKTGLEETSEETEQTSDSTEEQAKKSTPPIIPISCAIVAAVAGGIGIKSRKRNSSDKDTEGR